MSVIEKKLEELGITLPAPLGPSPLAEHVVARQSGELLFIGGIGPIKNNMPSITGRLVRDMKHEDGYAAARQSALNLLSVIKNELGDLDRVAEFVRLVGYVASDDDFYDQHMILNGASHLLNEVFGEKGSHVCTAVGVNVLPFNVPVILDAVVRVTPQKEVTA